MPCKIICYFWKEIVLAVYAIMVLCIGVSIYASKRGDVVMIVSVVMGDESLDKLGRAE